MSYGIDEVDLIFDELNEKIDKTMQNYVSELRAIRAGRANPHILDKVVVDYYGTPTPVHNMANISVPEARLLVISAWDKSQLKNIERAILAANIGINPNNDGQVSSRFSRTHRGAQTFHRQTSQKSRRRSQNRYAQRTP